MSKQNYMEKVDAWLDGEIETLLDAIHGGAEPNLDAFKKAIKDRILESYRNGQRSARRQQKENEPTSEAK